MKRPLRFAFALLGPALLLSPTRLPAQDAAAYTSPASAVRTVYARVSADAGSVPDWDSVRELFLPEAVIVLRASRESLRVLSLDGFIEDFAAFYEDPGVRERGFEEEVLELSSVSYGDIAQVWVLYEARIPDGRGNRGLDHFSLVRRAGAWRIAAVTNEVVLPDRPIPPGLFN